MTKKTFILGSILSLFLSLGSTGVAFANTRVPVMQPICPVITFNMRVGASDASTGGSVTALQKFLVTQGYFDSAYIGSGHFGSMTFGALTKYQASVGLPATGFAGPMTRAQIQNGCGVVPPNQNVSLYFISPSSGKVGTTVSLTGFGMTTDNTVLMDGMVVARNVPITSSIAVACTTDPSCKGGIRQTIQFTVPQSLSPNCALDMVCPMYVRLVTPGTYQLSVQNNNGTSNSLSFTVVDSTISSGPITISGLDTPSSMTIGQSGTWTVHATVPSSTATLHYSVVWGDEKISTFAPIAAPQQTSVNTNASFSHIYMYTGTYTPVFTVSDDSGHSVQTSASVTVGPVY